MAYVFPKHSIRSNTPIDYEEINENFQDLIGEVSGSLNEHNFSGNAFKENLTDSPIELVLCWYNANVVSDPGFDCGHLSAVFASTFSSAAFLEFSPSIHYQVATSNWYVISGLVQEIVASGGMYWILSSFQHDGRTKYLKGSDEIQPFWNHYGALYALRVNGQIIHETITGGVHNNPVVAQGAVEDGTSSAKRVRNTNTGEKVYDTPAIHGDAGLFPVSLDFILDLPPGTHTIDVVMQVIDHPQPGNVSVSNRELIILEMRA